MKEWMLWLILALVFLTFACSKVIYYCKFWRRFDRKSGYNATKSHEDISSTDESGVELRQQRV